MAAELQAKLNQMTRGIAPFMKHCQRMHKENAEYREMEYALRSHIATLEEVMHGDDKHMTAVSCDVCDRPLARAIQCKACQGVEDVCSGCCRYPLAHGWERTE